MFTRGTDHVWLTFATESNRVFDLDLSSPQFGSTSTSIAEIVSATSTTFNGLVNRIFGIGIPKFAEKIDKLLKIQIESVVKLSGNKSKATVGGFEKQTQEIIGKILKNPQTMIEFLNPDYFLELIANLA
jgi:hypothetical protein